jgi:hypothetical protein
MRACLEGVHVRTCLVGVHVRACVVGVHVRACLVGVHVRACLVGVHVRTCVVGEREFCARACLVRLSISRVTANFVRVRISRVSASRPRAYLVAKRESFARRTTNDRQRTTQRPSAHPYFAFATAPAWFLATQASYSFRGMNFREALLMQ